MANSKVTGWTSLILFILKQLGIRDIKPDGSWLISFSNKNCQYYLQRFLQDLLFKLTLDAKVQTAEQEWLKTQPRDPEPIIINHPIDPVLQTGESQLLGGAMEIKAPWLTNDPTESPKQ